MSNRSVNNQEPVVHQSTGNVFADLGLPEPEDDQVKATLAMRISRIITLHNWSQAQAARVIGIDQPKVSALIRGCLAQFSTDRLLTFLTMLDQDVEIVVKPKTAVEPKATMRVSVYDDAALAAK